MFFYRIKRIPKFLLLCFLSGGLLACATLASAQEEEGDPQEIVAGERLFLETRFAQFFFAHSGGDANHVLTQGDSVMNETETVDGSMPNPFADQSMNCRACHFVDEFIETDSNGEFIPGDPSNLLMKTYSDFARRSPIPDRTEDNGTHAPRNSPPLVNASLPRPDGTLFHFDAEFNTMEDLVRGTLTGRNYGWLAIEFNQAVAHIGHIVRNDDGQGELAQEFGSIPYLDLLTRTNLDPEFQLPAEFLIPVNPTDQQIFDGVARIIAAYVTDLAFSQDDDGNFNLTPYDRFLELNGLDRQPRGKESTLDYSRRLLQQIENRERKGQLQFVQDGADGEFMFHDQAFAFGPEELEGLKIFFTESRGASGSKHGRKHKKSKHSKGGQGNCIACHQAPAFTDFGFHNTGSTQKEYDLIHGNGAFQRVRVPDLRKRLRHHDRYLPATPNHPLASGKFRDIPASDKPGHTDLGLWNVFANPDYPNPQKKIWKRLCVQEVGQEFTPFDLFRHRHLLFDVLRQCQVHRLLPGTIALFKTPGLRDLGHSAPYFHNGQEDTLQDVLEFYQATSNLARAGDLRNGASSLQGIQLDADDLQPLERFLKALNEDYE